MTNPDRLKILFLCTGNSCRSQMAEGWANHLLGDKVQAWSAGIEAHGLNPHAVEVMTEAGIDISNHQSTLVSELSVKKFDLIVTVCDHAKEQCPLFSGKGKIIHHSFPDPPQLAAQTTSEKEAIEHYRSVMNEIRTFITDKLPTILDHL
jgi:arsenate reductase